jgi:NAD(P)-dependent dehydrogenase (short-subunit alcohol dehydrogenase family)
MTRNQLLALGALLGAAVAARAVRHRRAISLDGRTALITGGSRGLGLLIAKRMAAEGARVTIVARNQAELDRAQATLSAQGHSVTCVVGDIRQRSDAEEIVRNVVHRTGRLDILINNAGLMKVAPLAHMRLDDFEEAMAVHFWAPLYAMRTAVPVMQQQRFGRIVNISSIGGEIAVPHMAPYCASKFALVGISDTFRAEMARTGIRVTTVTPGLMRTGSPFNALFAGRHREEFTWFTLAGSMPLITVGAERAAAIVVDALRHGDAHRSIGWTAKIAPVANALVPGAIAAAMALANRYVLPAESDDGNSTYSGWQSLSSWAPSTLTHLTERAAARNNEVPQAVP